MSALPRIRQVALVAGDLAHTAEQLESSIGLRDPFSDPGVGTFGLTNAVYEVGTDFLEVVSPIKEGTTAGRWMERIGGDGGYMVIFQLEDFSHLTAARNRARAERIREVWGYQGPDIASAHLHPADMSGAIVSVDACLAPDSWRWGGPRWEAGAPADLFASGGIRSITVEVRDPQQAARRWGRVLGGPLEEVLEEQAVHFVEGERGLVALEVEMGTTDRTGERHCVLGSARVDAS